MPGAITTPCCGGAVESAPETASSSIVMSYVPTSGGRLLPIRVEHVTPSTEPFSTNGLCTATSTVTPPTLSHEIAAPATSVTDHASEKLPVPGGESIFASGKPPPLPHAASATSRNL